uniref:Uncharacterized protein n=1 Tax=Leersia perrieri TaxID=77586 RepID=A0A0D9XHG4_9ORYZ
MDKGSVCITSSGMLPSSPALLQIGADTGGLHRPRHLHGLVHSENPHQNHPRNPKNAGINDRQARTPSNLHLKNPKNQEKNQENQTKNRRSLSCRKGEQTYEIDGLVEHGLQIVSLPGHLPLLSLPTASAREKRKKQPLPRKPPLPPLTAGFRRRPPGWTPHTATDSVVAAPLPNSPGNVERTGPRRGSWWAAAAEVGRRKRRVEQQAVGRRRMQEEMWRQKTTPWRMRTVAAACSAFIAAVRRGIWGAAMTVVLAFCSAATAVLRGFGVGFGGGGGGGSREPPSSSIFQSSSAGEVNGTEEEERGIRKKEENDGRTRRKRKTFELEGNHGSGMTRQRAVCGDFVNL